MHWYMENVAKGRQPVLIVKKVHYKTSVSITSVYNGKLLFITIKLLKFPFPVQ